MRMLYSDGMNTPASISSSRFNPSWWLRGGHRQTIFSAYFPGRLGSHETQRHFVRLDDGDQLVLHENATDIGADGVGSGNLPAVVLLIPGLSGCHASGYMARAAVKLQQRGHVVFRFDMRGAGAGELLAQSTNHAGRSRDILAGLNAISRLYPTARIVVVGFSLGGGMLLRTLGLHANELPPNVDRALAVSPPLELATCCNHLRRGVARVYDRKLSGWMYQQVKRRRGRIPAIARLDVGRPPRSMRDFDARFTAPLGGFATVDEYYDKSSASHVLGDIQIPVHVITSTDDPVVPVEIFERARFAPSTTVQITNHGGHLGFLARRSSDPDRWWLDWRIIDFAGGL